MRILYSKSKPSCFCLHQQQKACVKFEFLHDDFDKENAYLIIAPATYNG